MQTRIEEFTDGKWGFFARGEDGPWAHLLTVGTSSETAVRGLIRQKMNDAINAAEVVVIDRSKPPFSDLK